MLVLPEDPVMPMTSRPGTRGRPREPARANACWVSGHDDAGTPSTARATSAATAPLLDRRRGEVVPVGVLADPGDVETAGPGLTGVGDDGSVDDQRAGSTSGGTTTTPPVDRRDLAQRHARSRDVPSRAEPQRLAHLVAVDERVHDTATSWPLSCPLPTTATVAAGPSAPHRRHRPADRLPPVADDQHVASCARSRTDSTPGEHRVPDRGGVLRAGVVVGETTRSATAAAAAPMARRLSRSRSPPAPVTHTRVPGVVGRNASSAARMASGCGRSRPPPAAPGRRRGRRPSPSVPGTLGSRQHGLRDLGRVLADEHERRGGHRGVRTLNSPGEGRPQVEVDPLAGEPEAAASLPSPRPPVRPRRRPRWSDGDRRSCLDEAPPPRRRRRRRGRAARAPGRRGRPWRRSSPPCRRGSRGGPARGW